MTTTNSDLLKALDAMTSRSRTLQTEVHALSSELNALSDYGRRSRVFIRLMAISVVLDVFLSIALGYVAVDNRRVADEAHRASSSTQVSCVAANESAKEQTELWEFLFTFPPPPDETPEAQARRRDTTAKFKAYLNKAFKHRDCSA